MGFPFFKDKAEAIADVTFGFTMGFVDGFFSLPINLTLKKHSLCEIYILAFWAQVVNIISDGGGITDRVKKVLEFYAKKSNSDVIGFFLNSGRLQHTDIPAFDAYMSEHLAKRRNEYDTAFRSKGNCDGLSAIALTHIVSGPISEVETTIARDALSELIASTGTFCISRLKKML